MGFLHKTLSDEQAVNCLWIHYSPVLLCNNYIELKWNSLLFLINIKCSKPNPFSLTRVAKILKVIWRQFAKYILNTVFHTLISTENIYILILWITETDACIVSFLCKFFNSIGISWYFMLFLLQSFNQTNISSLYWPPSHINNEEMLTGNIKLEPVQQ